MPVYMQEAGYEFEQNSSSISPGTPECPPAPGVLERAERCRRAVLRQPLHLAIPLQVAGPPRHLGQRPVRLPHAAARAVAVVPPRPRLQAPRRHGRLRHLRRQEQRRLEQLRRGRRDAERQAGTGVSPGRRNGFRELRPIRRQGARAVVRSHERPLPSGARQHAPEHRDRASHPAGEEQPGRPRLAPRAHVALSRAARRAPATGRSQTDVFSRATMSASQVSPRKRSYCSARRPSASLPGGSSTSSYVSTWSFATSRRRTHPSTSPSGR